MNLLQLQYFQYVAKHENFTKAAQELFVSQPALSQMIRQLEEELNVKLFDRVGKKIQLNEFGTTYLEYVNQALSMLDDGEAALRELSSNRQITISFAYSSKVELIKQIVLQYWQKHPEIRIYSEFMQPDSAVQRLINSEIDFALVNQKIEHPNVSYRTIKSHSMYLYLGYGHPLSSQKEISLLELKNTPFLCNGHTMKPALLRSICRDFGLDPDIMVVTNDISAIQTILNEAPYCYLVRSNIIMNDMLQPTHTLGSFHTITQNVISTDYLAVRNDFHISLEQQHFLSGMRSLEADFDKRAHDMTIQYMHDHYPAG